jgi:hypothetical protein
VLSDTTAKLLDDLDSSGDALVEFSEFKKHKQNIDKAVRDIMDYAQVRIIMQTGSLTMAPGSTCI